jgi:hypothetical protein
MIRAVGRRLAGRPISAAMASDPASGDCAVASASDSSGSIPAVRRPSQYPAIRSRPDCTDAGPAMIAMRRCPSPSRYSAASRPPVMSSPSTQSPAGCGGRRARYTVGIPSARSSSLAAPSEPTTITPAAVCSARVRSAARSAAWSPAVTVSMSW